MAVLPCTCVPLGLSLGAALASCPCRVSAGRRGRATEGVGALWTDVVVTTPDLFFEDLYLFFFLSVTLSVYAVFRVSPFCDDAHPSHRFDAAELDKRAL